MSDWYIAVPNREYHGMEDVRDMEGVYKTGRVLPTGSIVPLEWKGKQAINNLYLPVQTMEAYEPDSEDMAILYMLWPAIRPRNFNVEFVKNSRIGYAGQWAAGWYQVQAPHPRSRLSSVPYGVAALMTIEGVCKAGDVAMVGDIVPAPFFAGLSLEQFERLETLGLTSVKWLERFPIEDRADYMRKIAQPAIARRVDVTADEKEALYQKFPTMSPNVSNEVPKQTLKIKRKDYK